jgi:hypothetical protein
MKIHITEVDALQHWNNSQAICSNEFEILKEIW